jgi:ADP-ribose pyrophosphatase YjhB (NUDIX family)
VLRDVHLQMPLIHFNDRELQILHPQGSDTSLQIVPDIAQLRKLAHRFYKDGPQLLSVVYSGAAPWEEAFTVLRTGGGLVLNEAGKILLIRRLGKWDLPKGKLDEGETTEAAALREVEEETGVRPLTLERPLLATYHTYEHDGELILKENHWYLLNTPFEGTLKPQTEEDIEECRWVGLGELESYREGMYPAVRAVIRASALGHGTDAL